MAPSHASPVQKGAALGCESIDARQDFLACGNARRLWGPNISTVLDLPLADFYELTVTGYASRLGYRPPKLTNASRLSLPLILRRGEHPTWDAYLDDVYGPTAYSYPIDLSQFDWFYSQNTRV